MDKMSRHPRSSIRMMLTTLAKPLALEFMIRATMRPMAIISRGSKDQGARILTIKTQHFGENEDEDLYYKHS